MDSCKSCLYFKLEVQRAVLDQGTFEIEVSTCARYPTHIRTKSNSWCGEYKDKDK